MKSDTLCDTSLATTPLTPYAGADTTSVATHTASPERALRIALVTETFPPEVNGVAMTLGRLVRGLRLRGHDVRIVRPRMPKEYPNGCPLDGHCETFDLWRPGFEIPNYPDMRIGTLSRTSLLTRWRGARPDVVHVATEGPMGVTAMQAALELGIPCTSSFHTNFDQYASHYNIGLFTKAIGAYLRWVHNKAACTMVPTARQANELKVQGYQRVCVLSRGIDSELFHPRRRSAELRKHWGVDDDTIVLLTVGRMAAEKNLDLSVRCLRAVQKQGHKAKLVLVGDGPVRTHYENESDVICTGTQCGTELAAHYASSDMFLFPSLTETYGNVLVEAMASRLPTVSYFYAAAKEVVRDGANGRTVPCDNEEAFVNAACELANDAEQCAAIGAEALKIRDIRSWQAVIDSFVCHLEKAIRQRSNKQLNS